MAGIHHTVYGENVLVLTVFPYQLLRSAPKLGDIFIAKAECFGLFEYLLVPGVCRNFLFALNYVFKSLEEDIGYFGDLVYLIAADAKAQQLVDVTEKCFWLGAQQAVAGNHLGDIGHAVQTYAESFGYGVIRDLCGHGIGTEMHEDPNVPNYGRPGRGVKLEAGMTIAIEPMISMGTWKVYQEDDGWTVVTRDGSLCSHYEHTVLVTDGEPEILSYPGKKVSEVLG